MVVNDGSSDGTVQICRENGYPFLDLPCNLGLAGAFQAGIKYAYRHGYDCAIQFDADGQHLPQYIHDLVQALQTCDIAIGSRFVDQSKGGSLRMFGSNIIQGAIKLTTGQVILNMGPEPDTVSYLIRAAHAKVVEVPVQMAEREAGESYFNWKSSAKYMLRMTLSILFIQFFRKSLEGDAA